jgi:hypothetical protein
MRLFSRRCESRQAAYLAWADRPGAAERIALEAHAASCVECADVLRSGRRMDTALRGAFVPLRERRTMIAPGRVRLAVGPRATSAVNPWFRAPRFVARLAEVAVMFGVTLFAVGSSMDFSTHQPASTTSSRSSVQEVFRAQPPLGDLDYVRWIRLVKADVSTIVADTTRLPFGGRFDYDPVEIAKGSGVSPN